jgi:spermidine/putrescine transport system substrate-binding protein
VLIMIAIGFCGERDRNAGCGPAGEEQMAKHGITRRNFMHQSAAWAAAFAAGSAGLTGRAAAQRENELNILCWEGYNSAQVLDPFREKTGATVKAESLTNDPTMINRLRAGETNVWDLINVNNPWARKVMYPEGLIKPLDKATFEPFSASGRTASWSIPTR